MPGTGQQGKGSPWNVDQKQRRSRNRWCQMGHFIAVELSLHTVSSEATGSSGRQGDVSPQPTGVLCSDSPGMARQPGLPLLLGGELVTLSLSMGGLTVESTEAADGDAGITLLPGSLSCALF